MINPSIQELTKESGINRYALAIATAKCARIITDEYVAMKDEAEKLASRDGEKKNPAPLQIDREYRDEKAVKLAITGLHDGKFKIIEPDGTEILLNESPEAKKIVEDEEVNFGEAEN